jgi:hypothetical protein
MKGMAGALLIMLGGAFSVFCALKDYDFFMNNPKARPVVRIFGRNGARTLYVLLGTAIFCGGVYLFFKCC